MKEKERQKLNKETFKNFFYVNDSRNRPQPKETYTDFEANQIKGSPKIQNFEGLVDCSIDNLEDKLQIYEDKMAIGKLVNGYSV